MIRTAFFDLDETLVHSQQASIEATEQAFKEFGYDYQAIKEKTKQVSSMGKKPAEAIRFRLAGAGITEAQIPLHPLLELRKKIFFSIAEDYVHLYPGVHMVLNLLKQHHIVSAIVSSSSKDYIDWCIQKFSLTPFIDFIVSGDDVARGKPDPECYNAAYTRAGEQLPRLKRSECLVFEDTENGVIAAHAAGLKVLLIPSPHSILPTTVLPDFQLRSLAEFSPDLILL